MYDIAVNVQITVGIAENFYCFNEIIIHFRFLFVFSSEL